MQKPNSGATFKVVPCGTLVFGKDGNHAMACQAWLEGQSSPCITDVFSVPGHGCPFDGGVERRGCWWERLGEQEWAATDEAMLAPDVVPGGVLEESKVSPVWGQVVCQAPRVVAESSGEWRRNVSRWLLSAIGERWIPLVWVGRFSVPSLDTPPMPKP